VNRNQFAAGVQRAKWMRAAQAVARSAQAKHPNDVRGPLTPSWLQEAEGRGSRDRVKNHSPGCLAAAEVRDGRGGQIDWGKDPVHLPGPSYRQCICPHSFRVKEAGAEPGQQSVACSSEAVDSVWPPLLIKQLKQGLVKGVSVVRILSSVGEKVCSDVEVARDPHCLKGKPMGELCVKGLQREVLQGWVGGPTRDILAPCFATHSEGGDNATEDEDASQVVKDNTVGPSSQEVAHEEDEIDHPKEFTQSGTCPAQGKGKGCGILNAVARVVATVMPRGACSSRVLTRLEAGPVCPSADREAPTPVSLASLKMDESTVLSNGRGRIGNPFMVQRFCYHQRISSRAALVRGTRAAQLRRHSRLDMPP
jgi:hypothetical protein